MAIKLKMSQSAIIIDLLKASNGSDDVTLLQTIIKDAQVDYETADAYLRSYRHSKDTGAIGTISKAIGAANPSPARQSQTADIPFGEGRKKAQPNPIAQTEIANPKPPPIPRADAGITTDGPIPNEHGGKIEQILWLHDSGLSNNEIIAKGFNKSTVGRQVGEYKKRKALTKSKTS